MGERKRNTASSSTRCISARPRVPRLYLLREGGGSCLNNGLLTTGVFVLMLLRRVASQDKSSAVKASSLGLSDLGAVKKQLDEEIEQLTTSFSRLHAAQAKFRECLKSVVNGVETVENGTHSLAATDLPKMISVPG